MQQDRQENRRQRVVKGLLEMSVAMSPLAYLPYALLSEEDKRIVYQQYGIESVGLDG